MQSRKVLKSVEEHYPFCIVNLVEMNNTFNNAYLSKGLTSPTYYRLQAGKMFPQYEKMIYLYGDTLIYDDLTEMYQIDMNGLYYRGLNFGNYDLENNFNIKTEIYICAGVMLMNLKLIRENKIEDKMIKFIEEHKYLEWHDQTALNYVCRGKLGKLHPKYGFYNRKNEKHAKEFITGFTNYRKGYTMEEVLEGFHNPVISQLCDTPKPWSMKLDVNDYFNEENIVARRVDWWEYTKLTDYYKENEKMVKKKK